MPELFLTISFTVYVPGIEKLTVGFCTDWNCPLPKSQIHDVIGPPPGGTVERSVNLTVRGEHPESLSALKFATGAWAMAIVEKAKNPIDIVIR